MSKNMISAEQVDALLPQTQCTRCGFNGCMPYARAIADGVAPINQCPPGGKATIGRLAALLGAQVLPLNPDHGVEQPRRVAFIDEAICIGCTKCIQVCPVDAILGASKRMHTVIAAECTGCELCVPACPVDCISMPEDPLARSAMSAQDSDLARQRYVARDQRLARLSNLQAAKIAEKRAELAEKPNAVDFALLLARAKATRASQK